MYKVSLTLEPYPKIPTLTVFGVFKDPQVRAGFQTLIMKIKSKYIQPIKKRWRVLVLWGL